MAEIDTESGQSLPLGLLGDEITLVEGASFCISDRSGDISTTRSHGLFFRDARLLSIFAIRINGASPESLAATAADPFSAVFVGRGPAKPGSVDSTLMVDRRRYVGRGMREDISIHNFGEEAAYCSLTIEVDADFAPRSAVKEGRAAESAEPVGEPETGDGHIVLRTRQGSGRLGVRVSFSEPMQLDGRLATTEMIIPPRGQWSVCVQVTALFGEEEITPRYLCGEPVDRAAPAERLARWRRDVPLIETDWAPLRRAVGRSLDDLGTLRVFDPDFPERTVIAAGAPWYMTLFGRDALLTAWMGLIVDPDLALGVLHTLARFQGTKVDPRNDEEPGRILDELQFADAPSMSLGGGRVYYGTADATPLFVMLLGELRRWGLAAEAVEKLWPHADRAIEWIEQYGDSDGDGYVEYRRSSDRGRANQGWKDSADAIRFANGSLGRAPLALCEVQGYVYGAYLARAHYADQQGDAATADRYQRKAADLKAAFNRDFWLEERGWFAMALDADNRPVDALASNMGHCLWTGIVDEEKAAQVASRLMSDEMFSGWGVRTLARSMVGYNPISYHCGGVWPHDNAIIASGLMRYGFVEEAQRIITSMVEAASTQDGRLPQLFSGLDRTEFPMTVSYPTSCSPQAWAAGSTLLFLRTLLRLDPWVPRGKIWLDPVLPRGVDHLVVDRIPLAGARVRVEVEHGVAKVEGLPSSIEVITEPRHPLTATDRP